MKIKICSDIYPGGRADAAFRSGIVEPMWGQLRGGSSGADVRIANLECPLVAGAAPAEKVGPVLGCPADAIEGFRTSAFDVLGLANNHTMDYGVAGLRATLETVRGAGIQPVGAGMDLSEAQAPAVVCSDSHRVAVVAMADHEFGLATATQPGVNPLDVIAFARLMREQRDQFDYVIVLVHAGNEHHSLPSPSLREACRFMVECGANAVIVQHTHCVGCTEDYRGGHIVYGQGNCIFDTGARERAWHEGMMVSLEIHDDKTSRMELIPFIQFDEHPGLRPLDPERLPVFWAEMQMRNEIVRDDALLAEHWDRYCKEQTLTYMRLLYGLSRPLRVIDRFAWFARFFHSRQAIRTALNVVRCNAHREVLVNALEQYLGYRKAQG